MSTSSTAQSHPNSPIAELVREVLDVAERRLYLISREIDAAKTAASYRECYEQAVEAGRPLPDCGCEAEPADSVDDDIWIWNHDPAFAKLNALPEFSRTDACVRFRLLLQESSELYSTHEYQQIEDGPLVLVSSGIKRELEAEKLKEICAIARGLLNPANGAIGAGRQATDGRRGVVSGDLNEAQRKREKRSLDKDQVEEEVRDYFKKYDREFVELKTALDNAADETERKELRLEKRDIFSVTAIVDYLNIRTKSHVSECKVWKEKRDELGIPPRGGKARGKRSGRKRVSLETALVEHATVAAPSTPESEEMGSGDPQLLSLARIKDRLTPKEYNLIVENMKAGGTPSADTNVALQKASRLWAGSDEQS